MRKIEISLYAEMKKDRGQWESSHTEEESDRNLKKFGTDQLM
ncbi:MAG: hypothetical protein Q4B01_04675 [Eubacteriales bacterium]|nr:hypothetical protein [Eubacteriales bacterium]